MAFLNKNEMMFAIEKYKEQWLGKGVVRWWRDSILAKWEYRLLIDSGAIGFTGVKADYPVVAVKTKDDTIYEDLGGDLKAIYETIELHNKGGKQTAKIEYVPRTFNLFKQCCREIAEKREEEKKRVERDANRVLLSGIGI